MMGKSGMFDQEPHNYRIFDQKPDDEVNGIKIWHGGGLTYKEDSHGKRTVENVTRMGTIITDLKTKRILEIRKPE